MRGNDSDITGSSSTGLVASSLSLIGELFVVGLL